MEEDGFQELRYVADYGIVWVDKTRGLALSAFRERSALVRGGGRRVPVESDGADAAPDPVGDELGRPRRGVLMRALAAALALAVCACSAPGAPDGGPDGGSDAGREAGTDAGPDGGRRHDAGRDAGGLDGGADAGATDPGWVFIEGLPPTCHLEVARDPISALPPLAFEPCPGRAGCRRVVVDWPYAPDREARFGVHDSSAADAMHSYFTYVRPVEAGGRWWLYVAVARDDGVAVSVLRTPIERDEERPCATTRWALSPRSFATAVIVLAPTIEETRSFPLRVAFDAPPESWARAESERPIIRDAIQEVWTSDTTTALDSAGRSYRFGPSGAVEMIALPAGNSAVDGVADDDILASIYGADGWSGVRIPPGGTAPQPLLPATSEAGAGVLRRSGDELTWSRLIGRITATRYERVELWVSPVDAELAPSAPRFVSRLPVPGVQRSVQHRFGRVWVGEALTRVGVYDTATGERREVRAPPERELAFPFLGPEEIGVPIAFIGVHRGLETIELVRYDALPVVPLPD